MTNEQLRFMLYLLADKVEFLAQQVEKTIIDGERDEIQRWIGEGEEPSTFNAISSLISSNYETVKEGQFTAVTMIEDFAAEIRERAFDLSDID